MEMVPQSLPWRPLLERAHVGVPAGADVLHHVVERVRFLQGEVWRRVLRDQDKVLHGCKRRSRGVERLYWGGGGGTCVALRPPAVPEWLEENMTTNGSRMKVSVPQASLPSSYW